MSPASWGRMSISARWRPHDPGAIDQADDNPRVRQRGDARVVIGAVAGVLRLAGQFPAEFGGRRRVERIPVGRAQVIALDEVLGQVFPVRPPHILARVEQVAQLVMIVANDRRQPFKLWRQRLRGAVEIDEDEAVPDLAGQTWQGAALRVEGLRIFHKRRPQQ